MAGDYSASASLEGDYQFSRNWQFTAGLSYQSLGATTTDVTTSNSRGQFGALVRIVWRPDLEHRASAQYDGARKVESLAFTKSSDRYVGDYGYSAILQGGQDHDVPPEQALKLVAHMLHDPVTLTLVPDGDHRLSREADLRLLEDAVKRAVEGD